MALTDLLNDRCSIQRASETVDTKGDRTWTWATILSNIRCRVNTLSATEVANLATMDRQATHRVYVEARQSAVGQHTHMVAILNAPATGFLSSDDKQPAVHRIKHEFDGWTRYYKVENARDHGQKDELVGIECFEVESADIND